VAHHVVLETGGGFVVKGARICGKHWLVEFYGAQALDDVKAIRRALRNATLESGVTLLRLQLHHFGTGNGVTGVALLAESHISIHTWPERGYAAVDIFMCGRSSSPQKALAALRTALEPRKVRVRRFERGAD
jgi:S-adenosylmethionine decarboxylase